MVALKRADWFVRVQKVIGLTAETVESASLPLESIDNVHGCDSPSLGVLGVGDSVTDYILQEHLENSTGLLVNEARDTLDTTTASETADSGLSDALDVVTKDLPVTLGASLSKALASFATTRHYASFEERLTELAPMNEMKHVQKVTRLCRQICPPKMTLHPTSS